MPLEMPKERVLYEEETAEFNAGYRKALEGAIERFEERAPYYDVSTPFWVRVSFPEGVINEIMDKGSRLWTAWRQHTEYGRISEEQMWEKMLDELPDIINYAAFLWVMIHMYRAQEEELK